MRIWILPGQCSRMIWSVLLVVGGLELVCSMSSDRKRQLRDQVKEMFLHGYGNYITHAFPADELMPLSCKGRFRSHGSGRGDIDDAMGNFSLTLVDSLDTLLLLGEPDAFEVAVRMVIDTVRFDSDIVVSVFETTIRMLGGLLSAHVMALELQQRRQVMMWYKRELLDMSVQLGYVLLDAFESSTGMPYPRVNLKYGMKHGVNDQRHTCAACAGTMILEFAALSRLSGDEIFEIKTRQAMDYLWHKRHSGSSLMGHIIDVHSGDWIRRETGIGAGSDSYYEYVLKAYILLGDDTYLHRFHRHYESLLKYVLKGSRMADVHMHQPSSTSKPYLDALIAFFPGLQVLYGDVEPAKLSYQTLHKVVKRYNFLPEAFTPEPDLRIHWAESYLRPEFIESTYFLYSATKDPLYLDVGEQLVQSLETYSRVECGYAALKDTRSGLHDDRMDSYFLAETLKYLYLLFSDPHDIPVDLKDYIFTTEAHLLPLHLSRKNVTFFPQQHLEKRTLAEEPILSCPNSKVDLSFLWSKVLEVETVELAATTPVDVANQCGAGQFIPPDVRSSLLQRRLVAGQIDWANEEHVSLLFATMTAEDMILPIILITLFICTQVMILAEMGISLLRRPDGSIVISQDSTQARNLGTAAEGMILMQEMIQTSRLAFKGEFTSARVTLYSPLENVTQSVDGSPAQFGPRLLNATEGLVGLLGFAEPADACIPVPDAAPLLPNMTSVVENEVENTTLPVIAQVSGKIAVVVRGGCMFVEKARNVEAAGAIGMIVLDNKKGTSFKIGNAFAMSTDGANETHVGIPCVFLADTEARSLVDAYAKYPDLLVTLST